MSLIALTVFFFVLAVVAVGAIVATVVAAHSDGYRRIPTRRA